MVTTRSTRSGTIIELPELIASSTVAVTIFSPHEHRFVFAVGQGPDTQPPPAPDPLELTVVRAGVEDASSTCDLPLHNQLVWTLSGVADDVVAVEFMKDGRIVGGALGPPTQGVVGYDPGQQNCYSVIAIDEADQRSMPSQQRCIFVPDDVVLVRPDAGGENAASMSDDQGCRCVSPSQPQSAWFAILLAFFGILGRRRHASSGRRNVD